MSDLPTRDELNEWLTDVLTPAEARRRYDEACHWDAGKTDPATMMAARATRVLMTRREFIASLDIQPDNHPITLSLIEVATSMPQWTVGMKGAYQLGARDVMTAIREMTE